MTRAEAPALSPTRSSFSSSSTRRFAAAAIGRRVRKVAAEAARARHVTGDVDVVARGELPLLPPTLPNLELVARRPRRGRAGGLLPGARSRGGPDASEGCASSPAGATSSRAERPWTARRGGAGPGGAPARPTTDLALGAAVLLAAGRWIPGLARATRRSESSAPVGRRAAARVHARMTWTRFRDLVDRHHEAPRARAKERAGRNVRRAPPGRPRGGPLARGAAPLGGGPARRRAPDWTEYACVLAPRRSGARGLALREDVARTRRGAGCGARSRGWAPAERLAPALAALVDWDPGDLPIVPVLLDLAEDASREALRQRAIAWGARSDVRTSSGRA